MLFKLRFTHRAATGLMIDPALVGVNMKKKKKRGRKAVSRCAVLWLQTEVSYDLWESHHMLYPWCGRRQCFMTIWLVTCSYPVWHCYNKLFFAGIPWATYLLKICIPHPKHLPANSLQILFHILYTEFQQLNGE